jgi:TetR/AcrR family transcriptional regulator, cholesterol catabolism regulator
MDDVAAELDITKSSLYHYVSTKEELLFAVIIPPYREAVAYLRELDAAQPAPECLGLVVRRHLANVARYYPAISIYVESGRLLPVPEEVRSLDREYVAGVKRIIMDGMRDGSLRVQDPGIATSALLGMCNWFAIQYDPAAVGDLDEVAGDFLGIFLHGLGTRGGASG